jgi:hypothetical protein
VVAELGLHPLAVEDVRRGRQRAKIERYDDTLFVVLKTLKYVDATSDIETGELMVFSGSGSSSPCAAGICPLGHDATPTGGAPRTPEAGSGGGLPRGRGLRRG